MYSVHPAERSPEHMAPVSFHLRHLLKRSQTRQRPAVLVEIEHGFAMQIRERFSPVHNRPGPKICETVLCV